MRHLIAPEVLSAVKQRITAVVARRGAAGAQYIACRDGQVLLEHCHGFADVLRARPVTPATTFNAYSITKPFTAVAALALAHAGRLELDGPIGAAACVDGLERFGTVRETLLHRAGFPNPNPLGWVHAADAHDAFDEPAFVRAQLRRIAHSRRSWARSAYSNLGYLALGAAIERAWHGSFTDAVRGLAIDRLRLQPAERLDFAIRDPEGHARGHFRRCGIVDLTLGLLADRSIMVERVTGPWVQLRHHQVNGSAYGGLIANARGLARFGRAVLGCDDGLVSRVRQDAIDIVPGPGPRRSLAWFGGTLGRHDWRAHAGGGLGAYGELRIYPGIAAVTVLLTNGPGLRDARCLDAIDQAWLDS